MKLYDLLQVLIVGGAILFSALYALGRVAPNLRGRCAMWLQQSSQLWLKSLGAKIAGASGGCGSGCDTCGSCGPKSTAASEPLKLWNLNLINRYDLRCRSVRSAAGGLISERIHRLRGNNL